MGRERRLPQRTAEERNAIVLANDALAYKFAHRYRRVLGFDDALQTARLGLIRAADEWEPKRGSFGMTAWQWMRSYANDAIRALPLVLRPSWAIKAAKRHRAAAKEIEAETGRKPSFHEAAERIGVRGIRRRNLYRAMTTGVGVQLDEMDFIICQ